MRKLYILILLLHFSVSVMSGNVAEFSPNLRDINISGEELLLCLDSIEKTGTLSDYKINYYRSYALYSMNKYNRASKYADLALKSDEIKKDSVTLLKTLVIASESYALSSRLMDAANIVSTSLGYSRRMKNITLESNMMYVQGIIWHRMGLYEKSYKIIEDAITLLMHASDLGTKLRVANILGVLTDFYIEDGNYDEAWKTGERRGVLLRGLRQNEVISDYLLDKMFCAYYSDMAYLSYKMSKYALAEDYYKRYQRTSMSKTLLGSLEITPFLLLKGSYSDVVKNNHNYYIEMDSEDSLSVLFRKCLLQSAQAYSGLGNFKAAYRSLDKYNNMIEAYRRMVDSNRLFELYKATDYIRYEAKLEAAEEDLESRQKLIVLLFCLLGVSLLLLIFVLVERRSLNRKNSKISNLILQLSRKPLQEEQLQRADSDIRPDDVHSSTRVELQTSGTPLPPDDVNTCSQEDMDEPTLSESGSQKLSNEDLFIRFDTIVRGKQLYLNYQLQRDDYAEIMGVDRNRFALVIKQNTSGGNLNTYLNDMRLEYSITLFREHKEMTILEVGEASAIPSMSTFYRLFKDKYGISPKVFMEKLKSNRTS